MALGYHLIGTAKGCPKELLEKVHVVKRILNTVVHKSNHHKVNETYHQFKPFGVTGVILLTESHISIHTWPEHNLAFFDIFSCSSKEKVRKAYEILISELNSADVKVKEIKR